MARSATLLLGLALVAANTSAQDVTVVRSKGPGAWGPALRLVQELRIGQLEGAEEYTFGFVLDVIAGRDGSIFVAEGRPTSLRMYDARGKFVKVVGRVGGGPGEFQQINGLAVMADGNIAVRDAQQGRITILDPGGNFLRSVQVNSTTYTDDMFRVDNAGNFYLKEILRSATDGPLGDAPVAWLKANRTGAIVDTILIPREKLEPRVYGGPHKPVVDAILATLSRQGATVSGRVLDYTIDIERPGQKRLRIEREFQPLKLTAAEKSEWDAMADWYSKQPSGRRFGRGADGKPSVVDAPAIKYTVPTAKPAFRELRVDEEDRIWVVRHVAATKQPPPPTPKPPPGAMGMPNQASRPVSVMREVTTYDVFEPGGRFLGTVSLPLGTRITAMRGKTVWGVATGEMDEPYVVRYRIEAAK